MGVDAKIAEAVRGAVARASQPDTVADRLLAWFEALANGNDRLEDLDSVERHLEVLFQAAIVSSTQQKGDDT